jgi:hypothetical protein
MAASLDPANGDARLRMLENVGAVVGAFVGVLVGAGVMAGVG